jgi:hypothetical protein
MAGVLVQALVLAPAVAASTQASGVGVLGAHSTTPDLQSRIKGATLGSLVADALALSTHYEYDAKKIKKV